MTRQHLRALFSDSSSSVGSTRACLAASRLDRRSCGSITSLKQGPSGRQSRRPSRNIAPVQQSPSGKLNPESLCSSFLVCRPRSIGRIPYQKAAQEPKLASKVELRCGASFQKSVHSLNANCSPKRTKDMSAPHQKASSRERKFVTVGRFSQKGAGEQSRRAGEHDYSVGVGRGSTHPVLNSYYYKHWGTPSPAPAARQTKQTLRV